MIRGVRRPISLLCAALVLLASASVLLAATPKHHHNKKGNYSITVAGFVRGTGTADITDSLYMTVPVKLGDNKSGNLVIDDLAIDANGYFNGAGTVLGIAMHVSGRVDIPAGDDTETNNKQASTGRITATFRTTDGRVGRLVGIQISKTPATKPK